MIPRELMIIQRIPLNPNGKVDRNALPKPSSKRSGPAVDYIPAGSETEMALAEIWSDVLGVDRVGIHNNFFDIGGTSVLSAKLIIKIRKRFNIDISIIRVYHYPTIELMANFISRGRQQSAASVEVKGRAQKQRAAFLRRRQSNRKR